jgi:flavin reductase (DIM6/NTAB) family NADH-FMN oxidoreductase RutF
MSGIVGPQQIVLITSRAEVEQFGKEIIKEDVDVAFWHTPISKEEMLYAIAINNKKHVIKLIEKSNIFAINFVSFSMLEKVKQCSKLHGEHIDKIKELDLDTKEGSHIEVPILKDACAFLECNVIETKKYSDYTLFIAKIINSVKEYDSKRVFFVGNNNFTTTND